jgi:hypothetical protein
MKERVVEVHAPLPLLLTEVASRRFPSITFKK